MILRWSPGPGYPKLAIKTTIQQRFSLVRLQNEPLIRAAFCPLIGADPRNEVGANQRFLLSGKVVHIKLNHTNYSSLIARRISFLCFSRRSSRRRLSSNFFVGNMGARGRGRSWSFSIVILSVFFFCTRDDYIRTRNNPARVNEKMVNPNGSHTRFRQALAPCYALRR